MPEYKIGIEIIMKIMKIQMNLEILKIKIKEIGKSSF